MLHCVGFLYIVNPATTLKHTTIGLVIKIKFEAEKLFLKTHTH